jgi:hypothetical protein
MSRKRYSIQIVDSHRPNSGVDSRQSAVEPVDIFLLGDGTTTFSPGAITDDVSVDVVAEARHLAHVGHVGVVAASEGVEIASLCMREEKQRIREKNTGGKALDSRTPSQVDAATQLVLDHMLVAPALTLLRQSEIYM